MTNEAIYYLLTVMPILIFKLALIWAGVSIVRMGSDLLIRGVTGDFKFHGGFKGVKADLVSASPGLLFALLGVVLLAIGALVDKPYSMEVTKAAESTASPQGETVPPTLPRDAPGLEKN